MTVDSLRLPPPSTTAVSRSPGGAATANKPTPGAVGPSLPAPSATPILAPAAATPTLAPLQKPPRQPSHNATAGAIGLAPAWFKIGFEDHAIDRDTVRSILSQGRPFAADVDAKLQEILGAPFRAGGVEALFNKAWPGAAWVASYEEVDDEFDMPRFTLSALDRLGKVVFDVCIGFMRCADGAIDMHAAGADVDRDHRGFGITAYAELLRAKILQAYTGHPQSRLSLQASHAVNANTGAKQPPSGFYLHALRGYLLSDSQNVPSLPYPRDTPDKEADRDLSQLALLAKYFQRWAQKQSPSPSDKACAALTAGCSQPYDYTQMTVAGKPVGQAYLLSGEAPAWYGVHFVNPPAPVTDADSAFKQRQRSKTVWEQQLGHEIASAQKRRLAMQQDLWQQAHQSDAATRAAAYVAIGTHANPELVDFLQQCLSQETDVRARRGLEEGIARMRGERIDAGLRQAAQDPTRPEVVREEMRQRLLARGAAV